MTVSRCVGTLLLGPLLTFVVACGTAADDAQSGLTQQSEALSGLSNFQVGVFYEGNWYLDRNDNGIWDGCTIDVCAQFGQAGDLPVVGQWMQGLQGYGYTAVGVYRPSENAFYLDSNNNYTWDGCAVDKCYTQFLPSYQPGDRPVSVFRRAGGGGEFPTFASRIGIFRKGTWYLDRNGDGAWSSTTDTLYSFGQEGDVPVTGLWGPSPESRIGVFRQGFWYLDQNGDGQWGGCSLDFCSPSAFGYASDLPFTSSTSSGIATFRSPGEMYVDGNNNYVWDYYCSIDHCLSFGFTGATPVAGRWQ